MRRRFFTLDVFTDRRFAGNPLAVVLEPEGLDTTAMQAIAREFNLSETVFVLPPDDPAHRAKLRIFTPMAELPFAGHPTVGTAVLLGGIDGVKDTRMFVLEEKIGLVRCTVEACGEGGHARFDLPRLPKPGGEAADVSRIAAALSLAPADIGCDEFAPAKWSAGVPLTFVPVHNLGTIGRARPDMAHWDAAFGGKDATAAFVYCREAKDPKHALHARMFAPAFGIAEDPATGSAAAAFAGVLTHFSRPADGEHEIVIEQGYEMGRPSLIALSMTIKDGKLTAASIGGDAVVVSEGTIEA
jgi:trans-2,3-dihydro-3-hydroxyanthranilate isomerase